MPGGVLRPAPGERLRQFAKFVAVGATGVVVDFGVYVALTRGFAWGRAHYLLANVVSFLCANFNNFMWNRAWTFRGARGSARRQYAGFLAASLVYLAAVQATVWVLVGSFGWYDLAAKVAALAVSVGLYFAVVRRHVFGPATPPG